jgi:hypothetical protein
MGKEGRSALDNAEFKRVTAAASAAIEKASVGGGDSAADLAGISKDLLDSIEAVAKLPVWKPESTHESGSSPSKSMRSPDKSDSFRQAPPPEPSPNLRAIRRTSSSATSDKDKTFDDLVKKVESSPSSKFDSHHRQHQQHRGRRVMELGSVRTPTHSESRESDIDKSDYDETNNKGGVDYDDFFDEDDDYVPRGRPPMPSTSSTKITISMGRGRGRGRPRGSTSSAPTSAPPPMSANSAPASRGFAKVRGRPKTKPVTINTKALAQVHRKVAGTDYDFEDEFGDEFGEPEKNEPVSLQELREQSKKQYLPVYMQKEQKGQDQPKKKDVFQDFSDDDNDDFMPQQQQPVAVNKRGGRGGGRGSRGGGRGRGRPAKAAAASLPYSAQPSPPQYKEPEIEMPKLPKLKLGALLSRKESREKSAKSHRKDSASEEVVKVPKLKIKLGPKPTEPVIAPPSVAVVPDKQKDLDEVDSRIGANKIDDDLDPEEKELVIAEDDDESKKSDLEKSDIKSDNFMFERRDDEDSNDEGHKSPLVHSITPTKKGSKIDNLASRLLGAKSAEKSTPEIDLIFGPPVPLDIAPASSGNLASAGQMTSTTAHSSPYAIEKSELRPSSSASIPESGLEQKSELELLQDEMALSLMDQKSGASPHAHNVFGPLRKAMNAAAAAKIAAESKFEEEEGSNRRQHLKMKFKVDERHTSTPDPISHSSSSMLNAHSSSHDHRANPFSSSSSIMSSSLAAGTGGINNIRRMRKKELLNQYYGQEYSSAPTNGPTSLTSTVSSMLEALASNPPPMTSMSSAPPQPVRNIIKMPKAVASVTSVPTRADYQSQLEANLERKRKRDKYLSDANKPYENAFNKFAEKGGKKKKGRGKQNEEDIEYKPKSMSEAAKEEEKKENARKTRGKPPKKCLAESPPHEELSTGDLKAESMKFAEEIRAQFEDQHERERRPGAAGGRNRQKKRRRDEEPSQAASLPNAKTPRLVIKFSKDSAAASRKAAAAAADTVDPLVINEDPLAIDPSVAPQSGRNGLAQYDFNEEFGPDKVTPLPMVDGTMDNFSSVNSSPTPADMSSKVPKLKIKMQIPC